ncbi:ABC transporter permease [Kocuria palustris]|uniref:ABC transporter permease n=1 Tax=Kocuria palustris TaxID=71999 RepID=UPI0021B247A5|nr:ABC transporter permease subunit [Kocuria palustris]
MTWLPENLPWVRELLLTHLVQSVVPVVVGLLISIPVARAAVGSRWLRPLFVNGAALLYTIPSLTLFVLLPLILGTLITSVWNVIVALTLYVIALLVRSCADAFDSVDRHVLQAATAMGYTRRQRFFSVELPLAVPVMLAGVRTALVANISMVSVGAVIGIQSLGTLFTDGLRRGIVEEIAVGVVLTVVLALVLDQLLRLLGRVLTRWQRPGGGRAAQPSASREPAPGRRPDAAVADPNALAGGAA